MSDLIDRKQAIKEIYRKVREEENNAIPGEDLDVGVIVGLKMAVRIIKDQLSAEKKGEWIDNETSYADGVKQTCTCSVCGIRSARPLGDYCKWCGALMRGEHDDAFN